MRNPAGNNIPKPRQISADIQREPMHRHPPTAPDADRADLPLPAPYPRLDPNPRLPRRPISPDPIFREYPDRHLLQITQIAPDVGIELLQVKYRVSDQLPRPMEGDVSAPICPKELHSFFPHPVISDKHMLKPPALTQRIYRRMLDKQ